MLNDNTLSDAFLVPAPHGAAGAFLVCGQSQPSIPALNSVCVLE